MPTLLVLRGNDQGARFTLVDREIGLGRDVSNPVRLHDTEVSRRHAVLERAGDTYLLRDLDSVNGTYVSGRRITEFLLRPGDRIEVGGSILLYTGVLGTSDEEDIRRVRVAPEPAAKIVHSVSPRPLSSGGIPLHSVESAGLSPESLETTGIANPVAGVTSPSRTPPPVADDWLRQAEENLRMMYDITVVISQMVEIDELLRRILDLIFEWVSPDRSCILLIDEKTKEFVPKAQRSRRSIRHGMTISQTILEYVREKREGVLTSDALEDLRFDSAESIVLQGVREAICVPMQGRYDVVGAIYIDTSRSFRQLAEDPNTSRFTENHLRLMAAIANQAALAVEDTRYYASAIAAEHLAAVGQTIATISHHIKNILQGISGGSYLVDQGLEKNDLAMVRSGWGIVTRNQGRISALVMDMLTLSKEREPQPQPTDLNALCGEIVELMRQYAKENEVELTYVPQPEIPIFDFDPESLHKAILNLVTNGIDATAPKNRQLLDDSSDAEEESSEVTFVGPGHLCVTTEYVPSTKLLHVIVEDDGPGIPQENIAALFRPFTSSKRNRGTGLGLPVSEKIMREHGGRILVDSVVGRGTRFTLEWPAMRSPE